MPPAMSPSPRPLRIASPWSRPRTRPTKPRKRASRSSPGAVAYRPPTSAPMLLPTTQSIGRRASLIAAIAPMCATPAGPATDSTRQVRRAAGSNRRPWCAQPPPTLQVARRRQQHTHRTIAKRKPCYHARDHILRCSPSMPLHGDKARELEERLARLGVRDEDLDETSSTRAARAARTSTRSRPASCWCTGRPASRSSASASGRRGSTGWSRARMLADKIEELRLGEASKRQQEAERVRRQKRRRSRRAKQRMLRDKHAQSDKKAAAAPSARRLDCRRRLTACSTTRSRRSTTTGRRATAMTPFARVAAEKLGAAARARGGGGARPARERAAFLDLGCGTGTLLLDVRERATRPGASRASTRARACSRCARRSRGADAITWARAHARPAAAVRAPRSTSCGAFYDTLNHLPDAAALARAFAAARGGAAARAACWSSTSPACSASSEWWRGHAASSAARAGRCASTHRLRRGDRAPRPPTSTHRARRRHAAVRHDPSAASGETADRRPRWRPPACRSSPRRPGPRSPIERPGKTWWSARRR